MSFVDKISTNVTQLLTRKTASYEKAMYEHAEHINTATGETLVDFGPVTNYNGYLNLLSYDRNQFNPCSIRYKEYEHLVDVDDPEIWTGKLTIPLEDSEGNTINVFNPHIEPYRCSVVYSQEYVEEVRQQIVDTQNIIDNNCYDKGLETISVSILHGIFGGGAEYYYNCDIKVAQSALVGMKVRVELVDKVGYRKVPSILKTLNLTDSVKNIIRSMEYFVCDVEPFCEALNFNINRPYLKDEMNMEICVPGVEDREAIVQIDSYDILGTRVDNYF